MSRYCFLSKPVCCQGITLYTLSAYYKDLSNEQFTQRKISKKSFIPVSCRVFLSKNFLRAWLGLSQTLRESPSSTGKNSASSASACTSRPPKKVEYDYFLFYSSSNFWSSVKDQNLKFENIPGSGRWPKTKAFAIALNKWNEILRFWYGQGDGVEKGEEAACHHHEVQAAPHVSSEKTWDVKQCCGSPTF